MIHARYEEIWSLGLTKATHIYIPLKKFCRRKTFPESFLILKCLNFDFRRVNIKCINEFDTEGWVWAVAQSLLYCMQTT